MVDPSPASAHADGLTCFGQSGSFLTFGSERGEPFPATRRGQTAKAFCTLQTCTPHSKTVTATPRGSACGTSSSSFILGLAVGGRVVFPPLQSVLSPPAGRVCGDTVDSPLQRSDWQSSTSHSINPDKDAKGSPSWRRVPLLTIRSGYTLQFGEYPPHLNGGSTEGSKQRLQGFCSTAIAFLPSTERSDRGNTAVGHRTRVLQPKGDGGLRPILDLRHLNFSLYKGISRCWRLKTIMSQVQEGDWFVTIDLKDAYFHIQVVQRHRRFLRFAFGGKAYQYKVLPSAWLWHWERLRNAWMLHWPLWGLQGIGCTELSGRLAHSGSLQGASESSKGYRSRPIHSLGLRMNAKKSVLLPSLRIVFLGFVWIPFRCRPVWLLPGYPILQHVWPARPSCLCRYLPQAVGLMAAASPVLPLGLLHMRPFLWWMKELRLHPHCTSYSPYQGVAQLLSTPF